MFDYLNNKTVLVTGGCGTIGHELAKTLQTVSGIKHVVLSRNETSQFKLKQRFPHIITRLGDIKNRYDLDRVFIEVKPDVVIHAAAVKVVPVAEKEMVHTFETNAIGTYNVAQACLDHNIQIALNIGTDKQCDPINIYGMTKQISTSIFSDYNRLGKTRFCSVRYGNVLCSRNSLGVIIMEQAKSGQSLTVTNENMTRFFFTVQEAVQLIDFTLQSAYNRLEYNGYGETFTTEMCGVRLGDLFDIVSETYNCPIINIGERSGEKINEDLIASYELNNTQIVNESYIPFYCNTPLKYYTIIPHSSYHTIKKYSSNTAPRLSKDQIINVLNYAYNNTWRD